MRLVKNALFVAFFALAVIGPVSLLQAEEATTPSAPQTAGTSHDDESLAWWHRWHYWGGGPYYYGPHPGYYGHPWYRGAYWYWR